MQLQLVKPHPTPEIELNVILAKFVGHRTFMPRKYTRDVKLGLDLLNYLTTLIFVGYDFGTIWSPELKKYEFYCRIVNPHGKEIMVIQDTQEMAIAQCLVDFILKYIPNLKP